MIKFLIFVLLFSYENIKNIPVVALPLSRSAKLDSLCNGGVFFMKKCCRCNIDKPYSEFSKSKDRPSGLYPACKVCEKIRNDKYKEKNREKLRAAGKEYVAKNKDRLKIYRDKIRDTQIVYFKERYATKKEEINSKRRSGQGKSVRNIRQRKRMENLHERIKARCSCRIWHAIKNNIKTARTIELLGCNIEFLISHLESKFTVGMTWENYGRWGWHIDHIKPCSKFDLSQPQQQRECFHYTNLQPLWAADNIRKFNKYSEGVC